VKAGGGETVSFSVSAPADCQWAVSTDASWIAVRTSSGVGSNGGSFDVKANDGSARSGSVKVGELSIPVTQDAAAPKPQPQPCPVSVGAGSVQVKAAGETTVIFSVSASQECQWSASTKTSWITIEKGSGSGGANGSFVVKQNDGPMRSGQVDVGRFAISVSQDAAAPKPEPQPCPASVTPPRVDVKAAGDTTVTFSVSASQECQWSASTKTSWIIIEKGSGGGAGSFVVKQNDGPMRSGQVDVGRFAISVSQDAAAAKPDPPTPDKRCPLSLSPGSITVPIEGGRFVFKVIVDTGCPWSVASLPPWISLTSKAGTGTAEVIVTVAGNSGPTRTDIVVVNGVSITVSQKGTGLTR
jgi:hypothetical protein